MRIKPGQYGFIVSMGMVLLLSSCSHQRPETQEDIQKWNQETLKGSYDSFGNRNPRWNKDADDALVEYAQTRTASDDEMEVLNALVGQSAENAVNAGCNDPMIRFLYVAYSQRSRTFSHPERVEMCCLAASNLEYSAYSPIRKFYANVKAAQWLRSVWNTNYAHSWPAVRLFRSQAMADLNRGLSDKSLPESEAYGAVQTLFGLISDDTYEFTNWYGVLSTTLDQNKSKRGLAQLVKADYYLMYAWDARGNGYANQVTPEGWRLFKERLGVADKALHKAWAQDPYNAQIPILMMSVIEGEQKPRSEMEKWFERAMKLDPNSYQACRGKLHYLEPQWYGSRDAMLAFGRECVASTRWGGHVPLTLVDAHSEFARTLEPAQRRGYWTLPDVWPDIKAGYEKYAGLNPDLTRFRYPYAAYAFRCGQWQDFLKQIAIIRKNDFSPDYDYFGGKEEFDKMVALADSMTGRNAADSR